MAKNRNQKGDIFGFNDNDTTLYSPPKMDSAKQDEASIHFWQRNDQKDLSTMNFIAIYFKSRCKTTDFSIINANKIKVSSC